MGSLTHAAPELLDSRGNTTQSDIYAFGVLMYEVITGKEPFKDWAVHDLIQAKTSTPTGELLPMEPGDAPIHAAFVKVCTVARRAVRNATGVRWLWRARLCGSAGRVVVSGY